MPLRLVMALGEERVALGVGACEHARIDACLGLHACGVVGWLIHGRPHQPGAGLDQGRTLRRQFELGMGGAVLDAERVKDAQGVGDQSLHGRVSRVEQLYAAGNDRRSGSRLGLRPGVGDVMPAVPAHRVDDILRPGEIGLQQKPVVAAAHEILFADHLVEGGIDIGVIAADGEAVRTGACQWLRHDRPPAVRLRPAMRLFRRRHDALLGREQAMTPYRLDHLELVAAGEKRLDAVGGKAETMRHALGEGHAPLRTGDDGIWRQRGKLFGCCCCIAEIAKAPMVRRGIEAVPNLGRDFRRRLQVKTFDVAATKLSDELAARRISVDDDDAPGMALARTKLRFRDAEITLAEVGVQGTASGGG